MKRTRILALVLLAVALGGGCVNGYYQPYRPSLPSITTYDKPSPAPVPTDLPKLSKRWKKNVMEQTRNRFKDPDAVKYRFLTKPIPCSMYMYYNIYSKPEGPFTGYCGKVGINGKNSYGAYVGETLYVYVIQDDKNSMVTNYEDDDVSVILNPPIETW